MRLAFPLNTSAYLLPLTEVCRAMITSLDAILQAEKDWVQGGFQSCMCCIDFFSFLRQSDIESDSARLVAVFLFSDDHHPPGYTWEVGPGPTLQTDFKLGCCVGRVSLCRT